MTVFKIGAVDQWSSIGAGEVIDLTVTVTRRVRMRINTSDLVTVLIAYDETPDDHWMICSHGGLFEVEFVLSASAKLWFDADPTTRIQVLGFAPSHEVKRSEGENYVTLEPRAHRNPEFERMMAHLRANEKRRDLILQTQLAQLGELVKGTNVAGLGKVSGKALEAPEGENPPGETA